MSPDIALGTQNHPPGEISRQIPIANYTSQFILHCDCVLNTTGNSCCNTLAPIMLPSEDKRVIQEALVKSTKTESSGKCKQKDKLQEFQSCEMNHTIEGKKAPKQPGIRKDRNQ